TAKRHAIVAKIKAAREFGDLSENFEYHAAKTDQGMMEARGKELEEIVQKHVFINKTKSTGLVALGSTLRFEEDGEGEETYRIVGPAEANPNDRRWGYESGLGRGV